MNKNNSIKLYNFKSFNNIDLIHTKVNLNKNNKDNKKNSNKSNVKKNIFKTLLNQKPLIYHKRNIKYELNIKNNDDYKLPIKNIKDEIADLYLNIFLNSSNKSFNNKNNNINNKNINNYFISINYQIINYYLYKYTHNKISINEKIFLYLKGGNNINIYKQLAQKQFNIENEFKYSDTDYNIIILTNNYERYKILYIKIYY